MRYIITCILVWVFANGFTQTNSIQYSPCLSPAEPSSVGMSEERLERIDVMCQQAIAEEQVPGIVALVARNGKIVYHKAFGMADNASKRILETDDIFRIASQSKAITATAVMMLWEEGLFQLDDPISKYIPEFNNVQILDSLFTDGSYKTRSAKHPITIRHLLTHTSGIGYGVIDNDKRFEKIYSDAGITDLFTTANISIGENVKKLAKLPLHNEPGSVYTYSEGLDVLGYFVEVISGMALDKFFQSRIFDPLGMKDTYFYLPDSKKERLVSLQTLDDTEWVRYPVTFYDPDYPISGAKSFFSGGAGLSSTAIDYANFLQMYLNYGELNGKRLLSRTTITTMMSDQTGNAWDRFGEFYGLAFSVVDQNGPRVGGKGSEGTFRWGGYFNTQYFADPEENLIGILMKQTQDINSDETDWKFRILAVQAIDD